MLRCVTSGVVLATFVLGTSGICQENQPSDTSVMVRKSVTESQPKSVVESMSPIVQPAEQRALSTNQQPFASAPLYLSGSAVHAAQPNIVNSSQVIIGSSNAVPETVNHSVLNHPPIAANGYLSPNGLSAPQLIGHGSLLQNQVPQFTPLRFGSHSAVGQRYLVSPQQFTAQRYRRAGRVFRRFR